MHHITEDKRLVDNCTDEVMENGFVGWNFLAHHSSPFHKTVFMFQVSQALGISTDWSNHPLYTPGGYKSYIFH